MLEKSARLGSDESSNLTSEEGAASADATRKETSHGFTSSGQKRDGEMHYDEKVINPEHRYKIPFHKRRIRESEALTKEDAYDYYRNRPGSSFTVTERTRERIARNLFSAGEQNTFFYTPNMETVLGDTYRFKNGYFANSVLRRISRSVGWGVKTLFAFYILHFIYGIQNGYVASITDVHLMITFVIIR